MKQHGLSSETLICTARWPAFPEIGSRMCIQVSTLRGRPGKRSFMTPAAFREHLVANHGSKFEISSSLGTRGLDSGPCLCGCQVLQKVLGSYLSHTWQHRGWWGLRNSKLPWGEGRQCLQRAHPTPAGAKCTPEQLWQQEQGKAEQWDRGPSARSCGHLLLPRGRRNLAQPPWPAGSLTGAAQQPRALLEPSVSTAGAGERWANRHSRGWGIRLWGQGKGSTGNPNWKWKKKAG